MDGTILSTEYEYDISLIGIFMWRFNKEPCPKCSGTLQRSREKKLVRQRSWEGFLGRSAIYKIKHNFICERCKKKFTFKQIREHKYQREKRERDKRKQG